MKIKNTKLLKIILSYTIFILLGCFTFLVLVPNTLKLFQTNNKSISAFSNGGADGSEIIGFSIAEKSIVTIDEILLKLSAVEDNTNVATENTSTDSTKSNTTQAKSNNKQTKSNNSSSTKVTSSNGKPYCLKVNYTANVITAYTLDNEGNYTKPVRAMICSTGTSTPRSGRYRLGYKSRWHGLFGGVYGQYATHVVGNILIHSVPYKSKQPSSLKYDQYDKLGTACSMGCIRTTVIDAKWIYDNVATGSYIEFYSDSNPGPLGKPSARKISSNVECRNWDPTDPDPNNPWRNTVTETPVAPQPEPTPTPAPAPATNTTNSNTTKPENTVENKVSNTNTSKNNTVTNTNTTTNNTNTSTGNTNSNTSTNNTNSNKNTVNNTSNNNNTSTNTNSTNKNNTTENTNTVKNNNSSTGNTNTNKNNSTN